MATSTGHSSHSAGDDARLSHRPGIDSRLLTAITRVASLDHFRIYDDDHRSAGSRCILSSDDYPVEGNVVRMGALLEFDILGKFASKYGIELLGTHRRSRIPLCGDDEEGENIRWRHLNKSSIADNQGSGIYNGHRGAASASSAGVVAFIFKCIKEARMYLFKEGRKHYLDFLKNVSPQALLVFIGAVFVHGGLRGQPTLEKIGVGVVFWAMAALAAWCSVSLFLEPLRKDHVKAEKARARAAYPDIEGGRVTRLWQSAKRWWRLTPMMVELVVVMFIIEATCVVAALSGGFSAMSALRLG